MNAWCRKLALVLLGSWSTLADVAAAPRAVEAFDPAAWQSLQIQLKRPAAVIFSTTDCVHCPAVIEGLRRDIRQRKLNAALIVVVMDVAPGEADATVLQNPDYRLADRLFAFAGQAPAIRYAVDPRWRGVTPYVSLLAPNRQAVAVIGAPSSADFDSWSGAISARRTGRERAAP